MRTAKLAQVALGLVTSSLVCDLSVAADNCTGYDVLVTQTAETTDLGKGHTLTLVRQTSLITTQDAPIYNLVSGECQGSMLTTPDGKTRGSGHCARRDKDGDTVSIEWAQPPGEQRSIWKLTGGTGKFAGKTGSGWGEGVRSDGKIYVVKWGGTCN
jgi:hypothetical protein